MSGELPDGTVRLILRELGGHTPPAQDFIAWAVRALEGGLDTHTLRLLAGLDLDSQPSGIEASEKFHLALRELALALPGEDELRRIHVATIAQEILGGARQPQDAVDVIHREVLAPFNHPEEFMPWCYLWEGLDPDRFATLDDAALTEAILRTARAWMSRRTP